MLEFESSVVIVCSVLFVGEQAGLETFVRLINNNCMCINSCV